MKPTKKQQALLQLPLPPLPAGMSIPVAVTTTHERPSYIGGHYVTTTPNYIYAAQVHQKILIVTVYIPDGRLAYRTFQEADTFFAEVAGAGKDGEARYPSSATIDSIQQGRYNCWEHHHGNYIGIAGAAETITNYLREYSDSGYSYGRRAKRDDPMEQLADYQRYLREQAVKRRHDAIRRSISNDMLEIRDLPKKVMDWTDRAPLRYSRYIFYRYQKGRKAMDGTCSHCKHDVKVVAPRHRAQGVCPNCRSKVTYIANGRFTGFVDEAHFAYFQPLKNGYCIRCFRLRREYDAVGSSAQDHIHEYARLFTDKDHRETNRYEWGNFRNTGSYEWCRGHQQHVQIPYMHIYPGTLQTLIDRDQRLRYTQLVPLARHGGKLDPQYLIPQNIRYPWMEYLVKLGLYNLAAEVVNSEHNWRHAINRDGANLQAILKVGKQDIPNLRRMNPTAHMLHLYQIVRERTPHVDADTQAAIVWWAQTGLPYDTRELWKHTGIAKARRYLTAQTDMYIANGRKHTGYHLNAAETWDTTAGTVLNDWRDYIKECEKLRYNLADSGVLYPKDLHAAHARTSMLVVIKDNPKTNRAIVKRAKELAKLYGYEKDGLCIRPPADMAELIAEGKTLHHCVGGYAERHADGTTTILFIRTAAAPNVPYFTLEYKDRENRVVQCRGLHNCSMPASVSTFVQAWEAEVKKRYAAKKQQTRIRIAG